jgi:hypothetical protein
VAKLQALAEEGALTPVALAELRGVAEELVELVPTTRRLNLRVPDLDALERAASRPAAASPS